MAAVEHLGRRSDRVEPAAPRVALRLDHASAAAFDHLGKLQRAVACCRPAIGP